MKTLLQNIFEDDDLRSQIIFNIQKMDMDELKWLANQLESNPETISKLTEIISKRTGVATDADFIVSVATKRGIACLMELNEIITSHDYITYDELVANKDTLLGFFHSRYPMLPELFFEKLFAMNLMGRRAARGCGEILLSIFSAPGGSASGSGDVLMDGHWIEVKDCSKRRASGRGANGAIIAGNSNAVMSTFWSALIHDTDNMTGNSSTDCIIEFAKQMQESSDGDIVKRLINALEVWTLGNKGAVSASGVQSSELMREWVAATRECAKLIPKSRKRSSEINKWGRCFVLACLSIYKHTEGFDSFMIIGKDTDYLLLSGDDLTPNNLYKNSRLIYFDSPGLKETRAKGPRIDIVGIELEQTKVE